VVSGTFALIKLKFMPTHQKQLLKARGTIIHILCWITFFIISTMTAPGYAERSQQDFIYQFFFTVQIAAFFYINYILLIPKLLAKRKFLLFIILFIILIFVFSCISELSFFKHLTFPNHGTIPMEHGRPLMKFRRDPTSFDPFRGLIIYTIIFILIFKNEFCPGQITFIPFKRRNSTRFFNFTVNPRPIHGTNESKHGKH